MQEAEIYAALTDIFRDVFLREDLALSPELTAKDVEGWDSFKQIELILAIEQRYGVKFHTREIDRLENVGDMARMLQGKLG